MNKVKGVVDVIKKAIRNITIPNLSKSNEAGEKISAQEIPSRPMKYPYTYSAKIAQFPWMFYFKNQWIFRYWAFAIILCLPIFYKIQKLTNTPENKKKWVEIRKQYLNPDHEH